MTSCEAESVIVFAPDSGQIDRAVRKLFLRGLDSAAIAKHPSVNRSVSSVDKRIAKLRRRGELPQPSYRRSPEQLSNGTFRCRVCGTIHGKRFEARLCCGRSGR